MALRRTRLTVLIAAVSLGLVATTGALPASAVPGTVGDADFLGTAASLAVLGGQTVTNTGPSVITGDVAVSPGTAVTGFPPGLVNGTIYSPPAAQAVTGQTDANNAYTALEALVGTPVPNDLGGYIYGPGVYHGAPAASTLSLTGTLILTGGPDDVFVFQSSSTLITAAGSIVMLAGGARACNVFWQVGSSATLGTDSVIAGTIIARASITATTNATVGAGPDDGARLLALDGATTLDSNVITAPSTCADATGGTTGGTTGTTTTAADILAAEQYARDAVDVATRARNALIPTVVVPPVVVDAVVEPEAPSLAATAVDVRRPGTVAVFILLVGVILALVAKRRELLR